MKLQEWMYSTQDLSDESASGTFGGVGGLITHQLMNRPQGRLKRGFAVAEVEKAFEGRTQKIDDHRIAVTFGTEPPDKRDADATGKGLADIGLVLELTNELDSGLFPQDNVYSEVDIT